MKAVILAAGKGTRMKPLTDFKQKCILPICNIPILQHTINSLRNNKEIDEIIVVSDKQIQNANATVLIEASPSGTATSLSCSFEHIKDEENVLVINGDIIFDPRCINTIVKENNTLLAYKVNDTINYGRIIANQDKTIKKIEEKSIYGEGFINTGIYNIHTDIIKTAVKISKRNEFEITDIINYIVCNEEKFYFKPITYYWKDIGTPIDYLDANMYLLNKLKTKEIGLSTKVSNDVILRNNIIIGENCNIYNCVLDNVVIGNNCTVGDYSIVKRSVIMGNVKIPHHNYIGDSVIAENCSLGAGTKIANTRLDGKNVINDRRKLGAIIGYNVMTAINTSINAGSVIESNKLIITKELIK